jgi:hypothetical protein
VETKVIKKPSGLKKMYRALGTRSRNTITEHDHGSRFEAQATANIFLTLKKPKINLLN